MGLKRKNVTGNPELMRQINKRLVLNLIRNNSPTSRSEIASSLKLALPTVVRLVDSLIEEGLVRETGKGDSSGGRKPVMLEINNDSHYIIGVEICRICTAVMMDIGGNIISRVEEITKAGQGPEVIIEQVISMVKELLHNSGVSKEKIKGIGIGTPGTNFKSGELIQDSVFKGWENVDIQSLVKSKLEFPVIIDNIAKVLAIGELYLGQGKGIRNFVNVFADYGVGSGIVIDGDLYRGVKNVSGEFGHTLVDLGGEKCYCGNNGCLEMYTSIPAIIKMVIKEVKSGKKSCIADKIIKCGEGIDFQHIVDAQNKGDELVNSILRKSGSIMGIGLANLINLFNPDMIIMAGEISKKCPGYVDAAREAARKSVFSQEAQNTIITVSKLDETAGALGAAAMVMRKMFKLYI